MKTNSKNKIKILRVIARLNIGGPAIHTVLLSSGLDGAKFESTLVAGQVEAGEGDMLYLAREQGIRPVLIPELGRSLNLRNDWTAFWKLFALIKKVRPDIIHTHTAKAGSLGRLAGVLYNLIFSSNSCRLIHTFHGHVLHSYFSRIKSIIFLWIERFLALFTDRIIAVSESVRSELIALKVSSAKKIITVPLGLDLEQYLNIENEIVRGREYRTVGIIGRLVPIKNHRMFLEAVKRIKDAFSADQKTKFLIVGDGPLRQDLEIYAQQLGVSKDVTFSGWISDLNQVYSELDIVTLTSLNEGTPVALIEAQASGLPCVATEVGGVADVVEQGKSGILVPNQDTESFISALIKLLNSPDLLRRMGRSGRSRVKHRFSKERLINDIEDLYQQQI
ncbi:glycosyltransferase family 4 protein [Candidatus Omnitrophota bacterium]